MSTCTSTVPFSLLLPLSLLHSLSLSPSFLLLFFTFVLSLLSLSFFLCLPSLPLSPPLLSQLLGMLLRDKSHLVNSNILHLTFTLVGTVDNEHESARISNTIAFKDLLAGTLLYYMFIVCCWIYFVSHKTFD